MSEEEKARSAQRIQSRVAEIGLGLYPGLGKQEGVSKEKVVEELTEEENEKAKEIAWRAIS